MLIREEAALRPCAPPLFWVLGGFRGVLLRARFEPLLAVV